MTTPPPGVVKLKPWASIAVDTLAPGDAIWAELVSCGTGALLGAAGCMRPAAAARRQARGDGAPSIAVVVRAAASPASAHLSVHCGLSPWSAAAAPARSRAATYPPPLRCQRDRASRLQARPLRPQRRPRRLGAAPLRPPRRLWRLVVRAWVAGNHSFLQCQLERCSADTLNERGPALAPRPTGSDGCPGGRSCRIGSYHRHAGTLYVCSCSPIVCVVPAPALRAAFLAHADAEPPWARRLEHRLLVHVRELLRQDECPEGVSVATPADYEIAGRQHLLCDF